MTKAPEGGERNEQSGTALPCLLICGRIWIVRDKYFDNFVDLLTFVNDKIF